jgi:hypothetical protein
VIFVASKLRLYKIIRVGNPKRQSRKRERFSRTVILKWLKKNNSKRGFAFGLLGWERPTRNKTI